MGWELLIPIIVQYGLPVAQSIFTKWQAGTSPTLADFDELRALASQTAEDRMKAKLAEAGIALDSEEAKKFLELVK